MNSKKAALPSSLTIWNSGRGRSRIVIISHQDAPSSKWLNLTGSRWFFTSNAAAREFKNALNSNSYLRLNEEIPGGFNSTLWQKFKRSWRLESAEFREVGDLKISRIGGSGNTVILIANGHTEIAPLRIPPSLVVAANDSAYNEFAAVVRTSTNAQLRELLNIGGATINNIRDAVGRNP